jgi:hypothetical protein
MSHDEHSVALAVYSGSMSSAQLARRIGIEPEESWSLGDPTPRGQARTRSVVRYASGLPREIEANEQISALLARLASRPPDREPAAAPDAEVSLNIGYFINEPQWQERDDATVARGLGVSLNAAQIELLHQMRADFDVDIYVNSEIE